MADKRGRYSTRQQEAVLAFLRSHAYASDRGKAPRERVGKPAGEERSGNRRAKRGPHLAYQVGGGGGHGLSERVSPSLWELRVCSCSEAKE